MCNPKCLTVHQGGHQEISKKNWNKNLLSCRKFRDTKPNRAANQAEPSAHQAIKGGPNPLAQVRVSSERLAEGAGTKKPKTEEAPTACQDIIMLKYCSAVLNQHKGGNGRMARPSVDLIAPQTLQCQHKLNFDFAAPATAAFLMKFRTPNCTALRMGHPHGTWLVPRGSWHTSHLGSSSSSSFRSSCFPNLPAPLQLTMVMMMSS